MSRPFPVHLPTEVAFVRKSLFAVEIVDAVTLEPMVRGLEVKATGLNRDPIVNSGGFFVFLDEGAAQAQAIVIDADKTFSESITVPPPVLPDRRRRVELAPRYDYPFSPGATAMRGTLIESFPADPTPVPGAEIWLQWLDDTLVWVDAPTHSHSGIKGDFAALLRLTPQQVPKPNAGGSVSARLRVRRDGRTRTSADFSLPTGRVADPLPPFGWSELVP